MRSRAKLRFVWCLLLTALPLSCADLLGLEPGVLATGNGAGAGSVGSSSGSAGEATGTSGTSGTSGAGGGSVTTAGSGGSSGSAADGGSPAASGDAGLGGDSSAGSPGEVLPQGGEPNTGPCKNGTCTECPSDMRRIGTNAGDFYCIDDIEVTNSQYLAFTKRYTIDTVIGTTECGANKSLVPDAACGGALTDVPSRNLPVVCVDFCDAQAYCMMHGRRLCGRVGGVMNNPGDDSNAIASEWYAACAGPGEALYPYGDAASASACNGSGYAPSDMGPRDAQTLSSCEGSHPGLYNLSGNVAEWEWSCTSTKANALCSTRGGSFRDGPYELRCTGSIARERLDAADSLGFRCCADVL